MLVVAQRLVKRAVLRVKSNWSLQWFVGTHNLKAVMGWGRCNDRSMLFVVGQKEGKGKCSTTVEKKYVTCGLELTSPALDNGRAQPSAGPDTIASPGSLAVHQAVIVLATVVR